MDLTTSTLLYVTVNVVPLTSAAYVLASFCGGMTCVIVPAYPYKWAALNPFALNAHEPKLLLELVIDWSPPDSATK